MIVGQCTRHRGVDELLHGRIGHDRITRADCRLPVAGCGATREPSVDLWGHYFELGAQPENR